MASQKTEESLGNKAAIQIACSHPNVVQHRGLYRKDSTLWVCSILFNFISL